MATQFERKSAITQFV